VQHVEPITCAREDATEPWSPVYTVIGEGGCRNRIFFLKKAAAAAARELFIGGHHFYIRLV
jgi:hypothetical protein